MPTPTGTPTPTPEQWPKVEWWYECDSKTSADIYWQVQVLGSQKVTETYGSEHWESNFPRTLEITGTETHSRSMSLGSGRWMELYLGKDTSGDPWSRYAVSEDACEGYSGSSG